MNDLLGDEIPVAPKRQQSSESLEDIVSILTEAGFTVAIEKYCILSHPWQVTVLKEGDWEVEQIDNTCIGAARKVLCAMYELGYISWYPQ